MTARRTPTNHKPATPAVKLSGEMVEVPSGALANEATAAEPIAQDTEAPADEVADAIAELQANAPRTAPAKKAPTHRAHTDCNHAKSGAEGKKARAACRREKAAEAAKAAK